MATKTFKLGEYAKGGIITVETTTRTVVVIGKDWDMSQGTSRGSNQSNAKEFDRETVSLDDTEARRKLSNFLHDLTTHYYVEKIIKWIESKADLSKGTLVNGF
jgi:hypothetical protein